MKILAGFISYHFAKKLLEHGDEVVGLDNINDYYAVNLKYGRLNELGIDALGCDPFSAKAQLRKKLNSLYNRFSLSVKNVDKENKRYWHNRKSRSIWWYICTIELYTFTIKKVQKR